MMTRMTNDVVLGSRFCHANPFVTLFRQKTLVGDVQLDHFYLGSQSYVERNCWQFSRSR